MNPLYLFRKARKEPLDAGETAWVREQLKKYPYFALLHLVNARTAKAANEGSAETLRQLAALYAPNRRRFATYLDDKLARKLERAQETIGKKPVGAATRESATETTPEAPAALPKEPRKPIERTTPPPVAKVDTPAVTPVSAPEPPKVEPKAEAKPVITPAEKPLEVSKPLALGKVEPKPTAEPKVAPESKPEPVKTDAPEAGDTERVAKLNIRPVRKEEVKSLDTPPIALPELPKVEAKKTTEIPADQVPEIKPAPKPEIVAEAKPAEKPETKPVTPPIPSNDPQPELQVVGAEKGTPSPIQVTEVAAPVMNQGLQTMLQVRVGMYLPIVQKLDKEMADFKAKALVDTPQQITVEAPVVAKVVEPAIEPVAEPTPIQPAKVEEVTAEVAVVEAKVEPELVVPVAKDVPEVQPEAIETMVAPTAEETPAATEKPEVPEIVAKLPEATEEAPLVEAQPEPISLEAALPIEPTKEAPRLEIPDELKPENGDVKTTRKQERATIEQLSQQQQREVNLGVDDLKRNLLRMIQAQISSDEKPKVEDKPKTGVQSILTEIEEVAKRRQKKQEEQQALQERKLEEIAKPVAEEPIRPIAQLESLIESQLDTKPVAKEVSPPQLPVSRREPLTGKVEIQPVGKPESQPEELQNKEEPKLDKQPELPETENSIKRFVGPEFNQKPPQLNVGGVVRKKGGFELDEELLPEKEQPSAESNFTRRFVSLNEEPPVAEPKLPVSPVERPKLEPKLEENPETKTADVTPPVLAANKPASTPTRDLGLGQLTTDSFNRFVSPAFDRRLGMINDPLPIDKAEVKEKPEAKVPAMPLPPLAVDPALEKSGTISPTLPSVTEAYKKQLKQAHDSGLPVVETTSDNSIRRFVSPTFDGEAKNLDVKPAAELQTPKKQDTPQVKPKASETYVAPEPKAKDGGEASFKRFVSPGFGTTEPDPHQEPEVPVIKAEVKEVLTPQPKPLLEKKVVPSVPLVMDSTMTTDSFKRFKQPDFGVVRTAGANEESRTSVQPTPKLPEVKAAPPVELSKPLPQDEPKARPERVVPKAEKQPQAEPKVEAVPIEETPAQQPIVAEGSENTFTYKRGELELEIVLRPEQLKYFKEDPRKLFAEAAEEVLQHEELHGAPEAQITIDREKAVIEKAPEEKLTQPRAETAYRPSFLSADELAKIKGVLDEKAWLQLEQSFIQQSPAANVQVPNLPLQQGKKNPGAGIGDINKKLAELGFSLNPDQLQQLEDSTPVFGEALELHQEEDEDLMRDFSLKALLEQQDIRTKEEPPAPVLYELGGASGEYEASDEEKENEVAEILRGRSLPHPSEITLQTIQTKFLEKFVSSISYEVVAIPGTVLPAVTISAPPAAQNSVDAAVAKFNELEPLISSKLADLRANPAAYQDSPEAELIVEAESPADEGEVSETLAQILAGQGKKEEAAKVYRKLALNHPEKSAYFVAQIQALGIAE